MTIPSPPAGDGPPEPGGTGPDGDLPEAAGRRLGGGSFSSGLTVPDFAACLQMGLRPVGLVQGFCVMQWGWYGANSPYMRGMTPYSSGGGGARGAYSESYSCPHGGYVYSNEHRIWGQNYQQPWVESAWAQGFGSAYSRMVEEAGEVGAHGIIGVVDTTRHLADMNVTEFHILGTAVVVEGAAPPPGATPWTTYLAGQRLAKLVEAGYMPVSVVASLASVRVWAYCVTEMLMEGTMSRYGGGYMPVSEVEQLSRAHIAARSLAREHVRGQLGNDTLQGAVIVANTQSLAQGDEVIECALRGTRVRRFKDFDPLPAPRPTVRLS
jgi:Putative heavy-metal-binding